ncbi:MAG: hypothetical protein ABSH49_32270 [Bryobacteraceae bacterium]|jgi:hypothetical protein
MSDHNDRDPPQRDAETGTTRIHGFARYFKRYMGVSSVVAAALPIPVAAFRLIPTYSAQVSFLGVYTSLFAFLVLAFLFYSRHWIAHLMFFEGEPGLYRMRPVAAWLPLLLILLSLGSTFVYHAQLNESIRESIRDHALELASVGIAASASKMLKDTVASDIPHAVILIALYLGIFLFAEAAFVVMALREYLQDLLGVSERDLLAQRQKPKLETAGT